MICNLIYEGRILYQGPVDQITEHFSSCGFKCPEGYNPSDYVMFVNQSEKMETLEEKGLIMNEEEHFLHSQKNLSTDELEKLMESANAEAGEFTVKTTASYTTQLKWLIYRELLNTQRDVAALGGRFGVTIFISFLLGIIFLGSGK